MRGKLNNQSNTYLSVSVSSLRYLKCHLKLIVSHWFKDLEIGDSDKEVLEFCDLPLANIVQNSEHWIRDKLSERSTTQGTQYFTQYNTLGARGFFSRWGRKNWAAKRRVAKRRRGESQSGEKKNSSASPTSSGAPRCWRARRPLASRVAIQRRAKWNSKSHRLC